MNKAEAQEKYHPIFEVEPETEVYQIWFVGSTERDILGMLYKDSEGWVLRYRFRHYAEAVSRNWDDHASVERTAWDGRDTKNIFTIRPKSGEPVTPAKLAELATGFTTAMESMAEQMRRSYDPEAFVGTRRVKDGTDAIHVITSSPWAFSKKVPYEE